MGHQDKIDDNYNWPTHKFDADTNQIIKTWGPSNTLSQEACYVEDPNGTEEDDGLLFLTSYNFKEQVTSLTILDPKTMEAVQEYPFPFKLSVQFHCSYYSDEFMGKKQNK